MKDSRYKIMLVMLLCFVMAGTAFLSACGKGDEEEETPPPPSNSLTGATEEEGYDAAADNQRIAAFVVENAPDARPQWGMDDENYSPDVVIQGEVEGGITRTLWLYADYNKLPEIIGPMRSARPPFIKFSELFDSIFIHWGMSHSKGEYVGASTVFKKDGVDHINQMTLDDKQGLYDRDSTRAVSSEHRGILYGEKVPATIEDLEFRATPNEYTKLYFYDTATPLSEEGGTSVGVKYSDRAFDDTYWTYDEEDGLYHCSDFENDFTRENLLVLEDYTEYITKENYEGGGGGSVTYCDYKLGGGKGTLFSRGTAKEIEWVVEDGKLILKDPAVDVAAEIEKQNSKDKAKDEEEEESKAIIIMPEPEEDETEEDVIDKAYAVQPLNKGKTWIGWISKNNGGSVSYSGEAPAVETESSEAETEETAE